MILCSSCRSHKIKKNGKTHYKKQNHKCLKCNRQFVLNNNHTVSDELKEIARRALMERLSLRAICRLLGVSLNWIMEFALKTWIEAPDDLGVVQEFLKTKDKSKLQLIGLQSDEMWSFVGNKKSKAWIWVVYEPESKQVIAFHIGNRGTESMRELWNKIPVHFRKWCYFETDYWEAYYKTIPSEQHFVGKDLTYFIEGFFAGVRARVSRLVRKGLSFSKKWKNHIAAVKYYFWQFNLENQEPYI